MKEGPWGRQSGADLKPPQAAAGKSRGGERCGNAGTRFRQARSREASASEPLQKCRKRIRRCQNRGVTLPPGSARGDALILPERHPACRRREARPGFRTERENLCFVTSDDVKGEAASGSNREGESTEAGHRGGAARSSVEGAVMGLERRGCVVRPWLLANWRQEEPVDEAKPFRQRPNIGSRVTREGHARFWERPEVKFLRATRQFVTCRSATSALCGRTASKADLPL